MAINLQKLKEYAEQKFKKDLKGMENYKFIVKQDKKSDYAKETGGVSTLRRI